MSDLMRKTLVFILATCSIILVVGSFPVGAEAQGSETSVAEASPPQQAAPNAQGSGEARVTAARHGNTLIPQKMIDDLPPALRVRVLGTQIWKFLALVLIACGGLVLRKILQIIIRRRLTPMAQKFGAKSVGHVVAVFAGPGSILVVSGLLAMFYPQLGLSPWLDDAMRIAVRTMAILSIVLSVYRLVDVLADRMAAKADETESKLDDQLVTLVRKALKVLVILSGALFLLQNLDVNVGSLVTGLGIGGVAVALAAKDTIANFFGSLMIFIDRPFQIGDWVKIGDTEGIVEVVGFRSTRVRTFYNSLVTVPNAHFTESAIDNIGLRQYRRVKTTLCITYDSAPEQIQAFVEGIRAIKVANPHTR
jgi:MscS family membrane protein